jgi:hypothetical protein
MLTPLPTGPAHPMGPVEGEPHSGLVWFAEECMNNGAPLERYIVHAESIGDRELATFFRRALAECRRVRPGDRRRSSRRGSRDRRRG